jgi:hypothetical protein
MALFRGNTTSIENRSGTSRLTGSFALAGSFGLAWRATTRNAPFRVIAVLMVLLSAAAPVLTRSFFYFAEDHIHAEILVSNLFLWTMVFSFLVLPPLAHNLEVQSRPTFNELVPSGPFSLVWGRFLGFSAAYGLVALILGAAGAVMIALETRATLTSALVQGFEQVLLGTVLISGFMLFSQLRNVVVSSFTGVCWFVLGTQKPVLLRALVPGDGAIDSYPCSIALAWLPDFTLFQAQPQPASAALPNSLLVGSPLAYAALLVALFLSATVFLSCCRQQHSRRQPCEGGDG